MSTEPRRADAVRNRARILAAAEAVFAESGASASTEEVAARAGVAVGTVFRHFPTKRDLLAAIMKNLLAELDAEAAGLADGDPAKGLFAFFERLVTRAAGKRTVIELLAEPRVVESVRMLEGNVQRLLVRAQEAGAVRRDVRVDEVLALMTSTCQAALHPGWSPDLQRRTLAIVFRGLAGGEAFQGPGDEHGGGEGGS